MVARTLRVGSVPYLVGRPLDAALDDPHDARTGSDATESVSPGAIDLVRAVPSRLVEGLRDGSLDVALVSSIELFRRPGYRYLAGPVVAGRGPVSSVRLYLRRPVAEVRSIALDPASRTSAALVQCLDRELGIEGARFVEPDGGADPRGAGTDAWLRIGDAALRESLAEPDLEHIDPSERWLSATALPFVFALWIVRPGVEIEPFVPLFERARSLGLAAVPTFVERHARASGLPRAALERYLGTECVYDVGGDLAPALTTFRDRAGARGLCDATLCPSAVDRPTA
ncbi:Chorismate dehydratase [Planctomycetes bacterium Pla163]|uniref:Chorismate dehydratase n=1 Tax=Rohdeia mirabilis TaxID=2528008 RepID=A0A518CZC9_9BACT|nr:Chorismate dehydratase [Planctomycetes bacterium Pla163]